MSILELSALLQLEENWLPVPFFSNYIVSDLGNIKCLNYNNTGREETIYPTKDDKGTYRCHLSNKQESIVVSVQKLVLQTFNTTDNPNSKVKHIDGDKSNNRLTNLCWVTAEITSETIYTEEELLLENWKPIEDFPNYHVSDLGRVKILSHKKTNEATLLKSYTIGHGYKSITLRNDNGRKAFLIHRLVMKTFDPIDDHTLEVNHKDLDKSNNRLTNLEWNTRKQNMDHAAANGCMEFKKRRGVENPIFGVATPDEVKKKMAEAHNKNGDHPNYKLTEEQVYDIKKKRFEGTDLASIAKEYNQAIANISLICSGKRRAKIAPQFTMTNKIRVENGVVWGR